jgi:hypothetical protein
MKGKRGKARFVEDRVGRICINCGIVLGVYRTGIVLYFGGDRAGLPNREGLGIVCWYCGEFHTINRCPNYKEEWKYDDPDPRYRLVRKD